MTEDDARAAVSNEARRTTLRQRWREPSAGTARISGSIDPGGKLVEIG